VTTIEPLTDAEAAQLAAWRYQPPYDFYDGDADPGDLAELLDPGRRGDRYWAARDDAGTMFGFYYFAVRAKAVEIGLGLRPDLVGQGRGHEFFLDGVAFAHERFGEPGLLLNVAAFNARAIKVYERAGFRESGRHVRSFERFGDVEFVEMTEQA
jgi:RimJ/RimL family protein N-acetyltransferase